ncbi:biliverdin-producing heme oxygenase [Saccharothrix syringae]|uniref:Heme oxygenase n=1 Tax=Saccharothrix syringae TaxID=103733 RepID=A0A5Q0GZQ0_SACSY|nr:biliverdin-producing heme oxygenase [Saccharothrix syringae]QFZ19155.1 hypothetical protein EKG83_18420 [Saccharothrix syringae]
MPSAMQALELGTREVHARVEARLRPHLEHVAATAAHTRVLAVLLGVHEPLDARLRPWSATVPDWAPPDRPALLRADLAAAGWSAERIGAVPRCAPAGLPDVRSLPEALGASYVVEGSALGGLLVSRWLRDNLGLRPDQLRFYLGDGEPARRRFRAFGGCVERVVDGPGAVAAAVDAARRTFDAFERWFARHVPPVSVG